jgi:hypothetical protein
MAVTELLAKGGIFSDTTWDFRAGTLYQLDLEEESNLSLISYYQLLQENDAVQQQIAWTSSYMTKKSVLTNLIAQASQAGKVSRKDGKGDSGNLVLTCFFGKDKAHAAIAYGVEYGSWTLEDTVYDGRVLLADPYATAFSQDACLYFKSATLEWCVPSWGYFSENAEDLIGFATNSLSLINQGGYFMGTAAAESTRTFIPILEVPKDETDAFTLTVYGEEENTEKDSTDLCWFSTVAAIVKDRRAGLDPLALGYKIQPDSQDEVSYQISYEKCLLSVSADQVHTAELFPDAAVSLTGSGSACRIALVSETQLPWQQVTIDAAAYHDISVMPYEGGILLEGDCLDGLNVQVQQDGTTWSRQLDLQSDQGDIYTAAWIYAASDGSIGLRVDTDQDGIYETEQRDLLYGDVNLDGMVSLLDVITLNRYFANSIQLNETALLQADCDQNTRLNSVDATILLQYIVSLVKQLPFVHE